MRCWSITTFSPLKNLALKVRVRTFLPFFFNPNDVFFDTNGVFFGLSFPS
jgi:hypothetical protein